MAWPKWLAVAPSGIHVAAIGVWIGGLLMLLLAMHQDRDADDQLLRRFSRVASWPLVPVIAAGIALAIVRLDSIDDLFATRYGRLLIAEVLVVTAILVLGTRNNAEVRRRIPGLASHVARFGRVELILAALVLLLTPILVAAAA